MEKTKQARVPELDLIRIFALFCVISVHFFLNTEYYYVFLVGGRLYIATLMRTFFMICVPLFLMLSGYLMRHKTATKKYYTKLIRIIGEYVLACLVCMAYRAIKSGGSAADVMKTFFLQSLGILSFESARYSWYVEMYIGLFLLIPYLNVLYNGLQEKRKKQYLILTMLLLSGIPEVVNSVRFSLPWEMIYNDPAEFLTILPDWWTNIYPITYYFLGAYLNEYPLKLSRGKAGLLIAAVIVVAGTYNFVLNAGEAFLYAPWQDHQSLLAVVQSVLVFHFLLRLDLRWIRPGGQKVLSCLSDLCFCAYLVSYVFDQCIYRPFMENHGPLIHKLQYFFLLVPIVMCCSLATSYVLVSIYKVSEKTVRKLFGGKKEPRKSA